MARPRQRLLYALSIGALTGGQALRLARRPHDSLLRLRAASAASVEQKYSDLERTVIREYASFFDPMEKKFYAPSVAFVDPLNSLEGVEAYKKNIDLLAARSFVGRIAFVAGACGIKLHNLERLGPDRMRTRWTLRMQAKFLPWKPVARFTGISEYTLEADGTRITKQQDFWDSVNLVDTEDGAERYEEKPKAEALQDFVAQLLSEQKQPGVASQELPYELLRRTKDYEVRRYPAMLAAETAYSTRPEGFDRLGSYCGGSNEGGKKIRPFAPSIIQADVEGTTKVMRWPVSFAMPGQAAPTGGAPDPGQVMPAVSVRPMPSIVVAVRRFNNAATQGAVLQETQALKMSLERTGLIRDVAGDKELWFAQYDAIFSLGDRRNEVWLPLADGHPWDSDL